MAEAFGTASAVLGLAESAAKASLQLYQFFTTIRNAPQEIISISRDIKNFNMLVCNLQGALASPDIQEIVDQDHEINRALKDLQDPMDNCRLACDRVMRKLIPHLHLEESAHDVPGDRSKRRMRRGDVMWFWRRREVFALMTDLERTKAMFSDAMGSLTLLLTFRTSAIMTTSASFPMRHKFDDDAGSAIVHFASAVESEQPSDISSVTTLTPSEAKVDKENDPEFTRELLQAVRVGSTTIVTIMLKQVDINARDPLDGRTALSVAAEYGNVKMTNFLLSQGASVNIRQYSLSNHYIDGEHPRLVSGRFPLHWAALKGHSEVVELLLQHGANLNARNSSGRPALQEACMGDDLESVKVLLENGADVNARSYNHVCSDPSGSIFL